MRNLGGILLLLAILGFFYCQTQLSKTDPVPPGKSLSEYLEYPAGRWELGRYGCGIAGGFGFLMMMFPKGR